MNGKGRGGLEKRGGCIRGEAQGLLLPLSVGRIMRTTKRGLVRHLLRVIQASSIIDSFEELISAKVTTAYFLKTV